MSALALAVMTAGCERKAEPAAPAQSEAPASTTPAPAPAEGPAFQHEARLDAFGYYMPVGGLSVAQYQLAHLAVGAEDDLKAWEAGTGRIPTYAPVMLVFDDVSSPKVQTELGETYKVSIRVMPTRYSLTKDALHFEGHDAKLGDIKFDGRFDPAALKAVKAGAVDAETVVLHGSLQVGGKGYDDVRFTWFGGD